MENKTLLKTAFLVLFLPALVSAQFKKDANVDMTHALTKPSNVQNMVGLFGLDPNKFTMSHSYTLSFGSFGGNSMTQGIYLNTMQYQISNPLTMYLQLGFIHRPFADFGQQNFGKHDFFVSGAGLEYKPSENFKVQFEFSQQPHSFYRSRYPRTSLLTRSLWQEDAEK